MVDGSRRVRSTEPTEQDREVLGHIVTVAAENGVGTVLETPWADETVDETEGCSRSTAPISGEGPVWTTMLLDVRAQHATHGCPVVVAGAVGPFAVEPAATVSSVAAAHELRIRELVREGVDYVSARRVRSTVDAIGLAGAAADAGRRCALSFEVDRRGRLADGARVVDVLGALERSGLDALYVTIEGPNASTALHSGGSRRSLGDPSGVWLPHPGSAGTEHDRPGLGLLWS